MKYAYMFITVTFFSMTQCIDWQILIDTHKQIMTEATYSLLAAQQAAYNNNRALKIVDPQVTRIPIIESHEELVDVRHVNDARITLLPDPEKPFASPDCNSGFAAASKIRKKLFDGLRSMVRELDTFAEHFGYEQGQIQVKIFEGLRDVPTQTMLFDNKAGEIQAANPAMSTDEVFAETCKWVSPVRNNVPVHSTGAAVDIRLWDTKNNCFVDLGPFGVIWSKNTTAATFSQDISDTQKNNRLYLLIAATNAGLVNYSYEYWHYSCGDRYASYWQESDATKRCAVYGAI